MNIKLLSYNKYSASCRELKKALLSKGIKKVLTIETPRFAKRDDFCVVWGDTYKRNALGISPKLILNRHVSSVVTNKSVFFDFLQSLGRYKQWLPQFVLSKKELPALYSRITTKSKQIVCRTKLSASGGEGIVLVTDATPMEDIPTCGLYVEYIKKQTEFRVHTFMKPDGSFSWLVQEKLRKTDRINEGTVDYQIRNLENGWVYSAVPNETIPLEMLNVLSSVNTDLSLTFGAYDIIYNQRRNKYYILECNSAPGIQGDAAEFYADNILLWYHNELSRDITGAD